MTAHLQYTLIAISLIVTFMIIRFIRRNKLSTQMAVIWILWSIGLVLISIFPNMIYSLSKFLGIQSSMNTLFLLMVFILYCLVFFLYLKISILENKLYSLAQYVAIDENGKKKDSGTGSR
jgi:hypothetical protein